MAAIEPFLFKHSTGRVIYAEGAVNQLADLARERGCESIAFVVDGFVMTGGLADRLLAELTAGTGSEVSEYAIVGEAGTDYKMPYHSRQMAADIAILDPEVTVSAPVGVTAASGFDAVTHAVEAYTSRGANLASDPLAHSGMRLLARSLPLAVAEPDNLKARGECLVGSMQGAEVARIFGAPTAAEGLSKLRHEIGLDRSLDDWIKTDADRDAAAKGAAGSPQIRFNPRPADETQLRTIIEAMRTPTGGEQPNLNL